MADEKAGAAVRANPWVGVAIVVALSGGLALLAASDRLHDWLAGPLAVTERVISANGLAGAVLFVLFAALSGVLAFFSSAVIVPVAVHAWGPVWSALLLWIGWVLGGALTYAFGRWLGRPVFGKVAPRGLARYERMVHRDMPVRLVMLFQIALPSEVPGYLLGVVRYSFLRYIAVVAVGELPYAVGTVGLGASLVQRRVLPFLVLGVLGVLFSSWAYTRLQRRMAATTADP